MGKRATDRKRRKFRSSRRRRAKSLSASNWGPILALLGTLLGVAAVVFAIIFVVLPRVLPLLGVDYKGPGAKEDTTQQIVARPSPTPHPMDGFDAGASSVELVFDGYMDYKWFGDPYFYDGKMLFTGGELVDGNALMHALLRFDPVTRTAEKLPLQPQNAHFLYPKCNDTWLVYLDAKLDGGGAVMAVDLTKQPLAPVKVKDVYTGIPEVMLDGSYIAWIDRTGTRMDKLFVCDLTTMESTTLAMFSNSSYGQSLPSLRDGLLLWADTDSGSGETSTVRSIRINASTSESYSPGTYVHDPQGDGHYTVWLDDHHAEGTKLYYCINGGTAQMIAGNVVQCGLGDGFVAYSKEDAIYAFVFDNKQTYRITSTNEVAMFLGVSENYVTWMDVTSRERDIVKFARIPT